MDLREGEACYNIDVFYVYAVTVYLNIPELVYSSENLQDGMWALPLHIIHISAQLEVFKMQV